MKIKIWELWNYSEEDAEEIEIPDIERLAWAVEMFVERHYDDWEYPEQMDINVRAADGALWEFSVTVDYSPTFHAALRKSKP